MTREMDNFQLSGNLLPVSSEQLAALRESADYLDELKSLYWGKRCFIIGTEGDLEKIDWSLLSGEFTICVNGSSPSGLAPRFRICWNDSKGEAFPANSATLVIPFTAPTPLPGASRNLLLRTVERPSFLFTKNLAEGIDARQPDQFVALQLAYALGFIQVFMLGFDAPTAPAESCPEMDADRLLDGYRKAKHAFENNGRVVIDITPGGTLTIFPKSKFSAIFEVDRQIAHRCEGQSCPAPPAKERRYDYLVSAIVSTYNAENYIGECLLDLETQTIARQLEIVVVISGSRQNEESIVREFARQYDNIVVIKTEERESVYQAWNRGISAARGKYITNANTDDRHAPQTFERMAKVLEAEPSIALVYTDQKYYREVPGNGRPGREFMFDRDRGPFSRNRLLDECFVGSQPMWRTDLHDEFGYFDEAFFTAGDYEFWLRVAQKHTFHHLQELLGERLIRGDSLEYTGNSYLSFIETAAIQKSYLYAILHNLSVDAGGLSGHPVFSCWCELNLIAHNTAATLGRSLPPDRKPRILADTRSKKQVPRLSVVITTYNRKEDLLFNLRELGSQTCRDFEVIVVNNGIPISELANRSISLSYPLCYMENPCNFGPSHARNLGASVARGEIVAILDDDAVADRAWAANIIRHFRENDIAGLRGKVRPKKDGGTVHIPPNYDLGDEVFYNTAGLEMNTAFRRDIFRKIGGYDNLLFGFEGADLSYRIYAACGQQVECIKYFPDVLIYHDFPENPDRLVETQMRLKGMKKAVCKKSPDIQKYISFMWGVMPANRIEDEYTALTDNAIYCLNGSPREAARFALCAVELKDDEPLGHFLLGMAQLNAGEEPSIACSSLERVLELVDDLLQMDGITGEMRENYAMLGTTSCKRMAALAERAGDGTRAAAFQQKAATYENPQTKAQRATERRERSLSRSREAMVQFRDRHKGQRCVIIGNGPSLNKMDLSFLENEICFGMNRIYLLFDRWKFRPTYYVTVNPLVIEQNVHDILSLPMPKFVSHKGIRFFEEPNDIMFLGERKEWVFSPDPLSGLHEGWTVTYVAMQLAYYMGFSEVVLIGVDHHFATQGDPNKEVTSEGSDPNHFHPDYFGKGVRWHLPDLERSEGSYLKAKQAFEAEGRRILDATVDGKLTIFPKVDYRHHFARPMSAPEAPEEWRAASRKVLEHAQELVDDGQVDAALDLVQRGCREWPADGPLHFAQGMLLEHRGERTASVPLFEAAAKLAPDNAKHARKLAICYHETCGRSVDALALLNRLLEKDVRDRETYQAIGQIMFSLGQTEDARYFHEIAARLTERACVNA